MQSRREDELQRAAGRPRDRRLGVPSSGPVARPGCLVLCLLLSLWLCASRARACAVPGRARPLGGCARAGAAAVACALPGGRRALFALLPPPAGPAPAPSPGARVALCLRLAALEAAPGANASWSARYADATPIAAATADAACWAAAGEACAVSVVAAEGLWALPAARAQPSDAAFWSCAADDAAALRELRAGPAPVRAAWLRDGLRGCAPHLRALRLDDLDLGAEALTLPPLPALASLELAGLLYLPPEMFQSTPALESLSLRRCFLNGLPAGLPALRRLRSLEVTENQGYAFRVRQDQLSALVALEALRLTRTATVDAATLRALPPLPRMRVLDLSRTRVRFHDGDSRPSPFGKFPALEELRLSRNMMEHFPGHWLEGRQLRVVDLSENVFTEWPLIRGCDIGSLDLSQNSLKTVENLGRLNTTVMKLDLSMNDIAQWDDPEVFTGPNATDFDSDSEAAVSAWAEDVNLSLNAIVALSEAMTESLSRVRRVVLDDNLLDCADCGMPRWARWALQSGRVANAEALRCTSPPQEAGVPLAEARGFEAACAPAPPAHAWRALAVALPLFGACALLAAAAAAAAYRYRAEISYTLHLFRIRQASDDDRGQHYLYDAFVCYSGGDRSWVLRTLAPLLEAPPARYRLCLHERDFALGSLIVDNIARAIERSRRVVVVLSQHFVASKWCKWELDMANHRSFEDSRAFLILIQLGQLERRTLPRHLRFLMDTRTYLEWPDATAAGAGPPTATVRESAQRRLREALGPSLRERRRLRPRPRPQPALARSVLPIEDATVSPPRAEQRAVFAIEDVKSSARNGDGSRSKKQIPAIEDGSVERTYRGSISKAKLLPDTKKKNVLAIEDSPKSRKEV